jgi:hypothetical protein
MPRFLTTYCSQCGAEFGPGDAGFSHCKDHMTTATATISLTPEMLAQAFWAMGSDMQVAFFDELAAIIKKDHCDGNTSAYSLGELQWFFVGDELLKPNNKQARDLLMSMSAPLYLNTLRYCETR